MKIEVMEVDESRMPRRVPIPDGFDDAAIRVAEWIKANPARGRRKYSYARFHQDWDGEVLQTVYAVKWMRQTKEETEKAVCQLVFAGTPTRRWASGNLLFGRACGWFVLWGEGDGRPGLVSYFGFDPAMYEARKADFNPDIRALSESGIAGTENWPRYLDKGAMACDCSEREFIDYAMEFQRSPAVERLQKAGISYLWSEKRLTRAKTGFSKRILPYIKKNVAEIRAKRPNLTFIIKAMKLGMTIGQCEWHEVVEAVDGLLCGDGGYFPHEMADEVARYVQRQNGGPVHYRDYLDLSARMGRDTRDRGVLFPRDFCRQYEEMSALFEEQKSREMEEGIKRQLENLGLPMRYEGNGFSVRILDTQEKLTEVGNELHNCVGTSGYGLRFADGKIVVLAVCMGGRPVNCVELSTPQNGAGYRIVQNRGDHNRDSECQERVSRFLAGYVAEANRSWREIHGVAR